MNIIGISAFYHDSACCLLQDGGLKAAVSEERFSRIKHDPGLPVESFRYCLREGGDLSPDQIDCVAYYESPLDKLSRQLWSVPQPMRDSDWAWLDPNRPQRAIREKLGYDGPIRFFDHHSSHAASAFFFSGYPHAAVLTVDGVGEWATTSYAAAAGSKIDIFEQVDFPHSLGLLYSALTSYLGFRVNAGEFKVMGLAAYGRPRFEGEIRELVDSGPDGQYRLDLNYFDFLEGRRMFSSKLCELLGAAAREPESEITQFHKDLASSLQAVLEEILLEKVDYLARRVASPHLCLAGGVALNCVANRRIRRQGPFKSLFVFPAAGDAGASVGAAALAHVELAGSLPARPLDHLFLGPEWRVEDIARILAMSEIPATNFQDREAELLEETVRRLERGRVVGWFQGRMEFGPRALGARSLLADPRTPGIHRRINRIKKREQFRPLAATVLRDFAADHFELSCDSPFMLETCRVRSDIDLSGITHVDGSSRPQTLDRVSHRRFGLLLESFRRRTGCPVLLNTSMNLRGEPIACSPADALRCLVQTRIDDLVLGDFLIERERMPRQLGELLLAEGAGQSDRGNGSGDLYSFV